MANEGKHLRELVVAMEREDKKGNVIPIEVFFRGNWTGADVIEAVAAIRRGYGVHQEKLLRDIEKKEKVDETRRANLAKARVKYMEKHGKDSKKE